MPGTRNPIDWSQAKRKKGKGPPPLPHLLPPRPERSPLRRLFMPKPVPFDESLMTDEAREQFADDANVVE